MMFLVVPRRNRGVAMNKEGLNRTKPTRGVIMIESRDVESLARTSMVAWIEPTAGPAGIGGRTPLPPLMDVTIQGMRQNGFVLSGVEQIEQCFYAQSWWCRFE